MRLRALRGAITVIVGIQPDVAMAMVQLGLGTGSVATALDHLTAQQSMAPAQLRVARRTS